MREKTAVAVRSPGRAAPAALRGIHFDGLEAQLPGWSGLEEMLFRNLRGHGDFGRWQRAVSGLPAPDACTRSYGDTVTVSAELPAAEKEKLRDALQALHPWRKGPFSLCGIHIDSEWRSDFKWRRIAPHLALARIRHQLPAADADALALRGRAPSSRFDVLSPTPASSSGPRDQAGRRLDALTTKVGDGFGLEGLRVLDVGCGNGYYGWRMLGAGAALVIGIDPSVLYCMQHQAVNRLIGDHRNQVLPLALEALPEAYSAGRFDAAFSMGVLYHRRDPLEHLRRIERCLVPGGVLVIESLCVDGPETLVPGGRYARMRNVWHVPAERQLVHWMSECGFRDIRFVDTTVTTTAEQRSTAWMRFDSLAEALDPADATRTVEGHPAPRRCLLTARKPG